MSSHVGDLFKRKQDAEEVREIQKKTEARRKKAYKNYEESCKIKGKFLVRSCMPLQQCLDKQKIVPANKKKSEEIVILKTKIKKIFNSN